jgi:cytochrome c
MKSIAIGLVMAVGAAAAGTVTAGEEELAQKSGCLMCHAVDTKKIGPAFKEVAKQLQGKTDAEAFAKWKNQKNHAVVKASDDDVKTVLKWVMTLQ